MPKPLRCYVLRAEDGGLFCGAHPYDSREEAEAAVEMAGISDDPAAPLEVVELVEVVRCGDCKWFRIDFDDEPPESCCKCDGYVTWCYDDWHCADWEPTNAP